uniref:Oligopeptide ABC transporter permease protein n=1 Tax=uncultured alpha proteobacterium 01-003886 TaxID=511970 RepID=B1PM53_9PROT|nr:oligopeptide ABC transporter permease protein [uncultured alpha proteobacterium 01-003886]
MSAKTMKSLQQDKEAYFTASQSQLIWAPVQETTCGMIAAGVLVFIIVIGILAPALSPYDPTIAGRDRDYLNGAPQIPQFCDKNGCSLRPFIHGVERTRSAETNFRWVEEPNEDIRHYIAFFVEGSEFDLFGVIPMDTHLFGLQGDEKMIHLFGTDSAGKDIFSRTLHAIFTSLQIGTLGVLISFVLALIIGGVSGYYGGRLDSVIQMVTDAVRTIPAIPLVMSVAAFVPTEWTSEQRFFMIAIILGLIGWPTLARRVRTHLLTERNQEYVLAAQLCGASSPHIIRRHLLPSFTSYIMSIWMISFPYMVLTETGPSFIGLGLKDPVNSLGVMLQNVTKADVLLNYQWYFIPVLFFVALVMAFVFVGDGLRDAADPYSDSKK